MNRKFKTIAAVVLLMGVASLMGSCKEDVNVFPNPNNTVLLLEVGEQKTMSCTFNKGKNVKWDRSNDCLIFQELRKQEPDEIGIRGLKEGDCRVTATGVKGTKDYCNVEVKTYLRPQEPINLYKGDSASVEIRSGFGLKYEISNSFYATINSFTRNTESCHESQNYNPDDNNHTLNIGIGESDYKYNKYEGHILAKYVGETNIVFFDSETGGNSVCKSVLVKVNPRYTTYVEPGIDCDDTRDSVWMKLGRPDISYFTNEGDLVYNYENYSTTNHLTVMFDKDSSNNIVYGYALQFEDEEIQQEIPAFIEERYAYWSLYGYYMNADDYTQATLFLSYDNGVVMYIPMCGNNSLQIDRIKQDIQSRLVL